MKKYKKKKNEMSDLIRHCRTLEQLNRRMFRKTSFEAHERSHFADDSSSEEDREYPPFSIK